MPTIRGSVVVHETDAGAPGLVVAVAEAGPWTDARSAPRFGTATTGPDGMFELAIDRATDRALAVQVFQPTVGTAESSPPVALETIGVVDREATVSLKLRVSADALAAHARPADLLSYRLTADRARVLAAVDVPDTQAWLTRIAKLRGEGRKTFESLAFREVGIRKRSFVAPSDDAAEEIDRVVRAGLEQLGATAGKLNGVKITLDRTRLADLGFEISDDGELISAPDSIPHAKLKAHLRPKLDLAPGMRRKDDGCGSTKEAADRFGELTGQRMPDVIELFGPLSRNGGSSTNGASQPSQPEERAQPDESSEPDRGDEANPAPLDLTRYVLDALDRRAPEVGTRPDHETLRRDLHTQLAGGPADATAYHDFHSLQIAWENVWTAMVDEELSEEIAAVYSRIVQISETHGRNFGVGHSELNDVRSMLRAMRRQAAELEEGTADVDPDLRRLRRTLLGIERRLGERFAFDVFKDGSYNYGILTTYRQRWQPLSYQVGDLVASMPLAPGEKRAFVKRTVVNEKRAQREVRKAIFSRAMEDQRTHRADAEIVRKASSSTNFDMSVQGSLSIGLEGVGEGGITHTTRFATNQAQESAETQRSFREAVRKAATEYRNERTIEVSTERGFERTFEEKGEISNPNNEITVTYLFYELQRRYHVSERLQAITPVILVALPVPPPNGIDEPWLLAHEWILRRVLLDDSMNEAFDKLTDGFLSEEIGVEALRIQWQTQLAVVRDLKENVGLRKEDVTNARHSVEKRSTQKRRKEGLFERMFEGLFGGVDDKKTAAAQAEAVARALQAAEEDLSEVEDTLGASLTALKEATDAYLEAIKGRQERRLAIDRLRMHVKQNILYYMQAIWTHTPPDQRYFSLYDLEVEDPEPGEDCVVHEETVRRERRGLIGTILDAILDEDGEERTTIRVSCPAPKPGSKRRLHEVADLDRLLGFKGNYAIFPLRESNALTDFMMQDYVDEDDGLVDPADVISGVDPFELISRMRCGRYRAALARDPIDRDNVVARAREVLAKMQPKGEVVIVPSGQLFIEALPGAHPLLEDFKLRHRALDVAAAHEERRRAELENLRLASRLIAGEREDPETERVVVVRDGRAVGVDIDVDGGGDGDDS